MARNMVAEKTIFQTWTKDGKFNIQNNRILWGTIHLFWRTINTKQQLRTIHSKAYRKNCKGSQQLWTISNNHIKQATKPLSACKC
jgi:hypothetical protein